MTAYLIANPPKVRQFYATRNKPLTGCTVLHTSESIMDSVGPDTGAENVAEFIRTRSTAGSYHDLVDSDSVVNLVPYESGAFHDGTGSNNWALSISFACATSDWRRMTPEKRAAFLRNGACAFAAQQAWRRAHGYPTTELRHITKAQSDAGMSGFCFHGDRDPDRRSDPGVAAPNLFPFDEFITHCRAALAGDLEEDFMATMSDSEKAELLNFVRRGPIAVWDDLNGNPLIIERNSGQPREARGVLGDVYVHTVALINMVQELVGRPGADIDEEALAVSLAPLLTKATATLSDADLAAVATAVTDEQDRRARDGNPVTGPVS
ncbi:hypothetical protein [Modestobacter sp. VKM Ac-2985]|uniref:hypothetical protein n=1 Tax=Modestobacter sp. VKM Ac-2985 TaxID=3004139 RepID=UPI0022AB8852|nr:hypothetical protein [Modestobacter sp. VKM Ac-2985]MCZ2837131.1 hypothetical protein [Modestobacter sp. VKM Ac-2985]